jgi:hypothetical protein
MANDGNIFTAPKTSSLEMELRSRKRKRDDRDKSATASKTVHSDVSQRNDAIYLPCEDGGSRFSSPLSLPPDDLSDANVEDSHRALRNAGSLPRTSRDESPSSVVESNNPTTTMSPSRYLWPPSSCSLHPQICQWLLSLPLPQASSM